MKQRFGVNYNSSGLGYMVFSLDGEEVVFTSPNKSECIRKAQDLNGWRVTGNEQDYAKQREQTR